MAFILKIMNRCVKCDAINQPWFHRVYVGQIIHLHLRILLFSSSIFHQYRQYIFILHDYPSFLIDLFYFLRLSSSKRTQEKLSTEKKMAARLRIIITVWQKLRRIQKKIQIIINRPEQIDVSDSKQSSRKGICTESSRTISKINPKIHLSRPPKRVKCTLIFDFLAITRKQYV